MIKVRNARLDDVPRLNDIGNHYIVKSQATFDTESYTLEKRQQWFGKYATVGRYRLFVAELNAEVVGFASSNSYRDHSAFDQTIETSVYVDPQKHSLGIASELYMALFENLKNEKLNLAVAGIALPNDGSIALHKKFGFEEVGVFKNYAIKNGKFISSFWMQKELAP